MGFLILGGTVAARLLPAMVGVLLLASCGGGGGDSQGSTPLNVGSPAPVWAQGSYASSATYAAQCVQPRIGTNPATGAAYADKQGTTLLENFWLRSWTHELYLWYREVVDRDPSLYGTTASYFDMQKTTATTSSGKAKDQFHFTYNTADWIALSQSGVSAGYGLEWAMIINTPPRVLRIAYVEPNSPASSANLSRGVTVLAIDNVSINSNTSSGIATLNAGISPASGTTHSFLLQELNGTQRTVSMTAAAVTATPVQNVKTVATAAGAVGYMLFNDHIATSEQLLINAFNQLKQTGVSDLVLDLRYNGGGYLAIAAEVGYMIAGSSTSGKVFERSSFNDQYASTINPVTGGSNAAMPFYATSSAGAALPTLNLSRVFVITGSGTCSASESIINGLRGIGMTVIQIGGTTCGKPYGFYPADNCGTTYFSVQFKGVNEAGFGDYPDGFAPSNASGGGVFLPGCSVADDFDHALGDSDEKRLAATLFYRANSYCSPAFSVAERVQIQQQESEVGTALTTPDEPWRNNRILGTPGNP
jgi:carboxyl-terminal processing protease